GTGNVALGSFALNTVTIGTNNVALGSYVLDATTASNNVGVGHSALTGNTTASNGVAIGFTALYSNTTGANNVAVGSTALEFNTTGANNVAVGYGAGSFNDLNASCTFVGYDADQSVATDFTNGTAIGNGARLTASNSARIGDASVTSIGGYADWTNVSDGRFKTDVAATVPGLEFIMALRPVVYHLDIRAINAHLNIADSLIDQNAVATKSAELQSGFIAQEVEAAAQKLHYEFSGVDAPENEQDTYGLRYGQFVVPMVQAMQEQQAEIELLKTLIQQQQDLINSLTEKVEAINTQKL
ncbi:MAG: tail fiber domain-containing protein, partial [Chitinophagales bacterium]|nr:tail fiber domain-containing protein [Chitinophagales bacterium]